ncbi:leucine-rich repeat-containing protein 49 isoform X2 [Pristis pectinata]|uniref:leucine-rich repeat-containing protein 49 isoform X2 n=1 Tax=Pristis pectinata TaxID=685728 RepID=UPI00223DA739|nr:leucine-rich repeat-containing protein 49 isoform X2 [Pristis pectinata]
MLPGKYRARQLGNAINTCSLQLTVQASAVGDRLSQKQQLDYKVNKELLSSHKLLSVDGDKNFHGKPEVTCHDDSLRHSSEPLSKGTTAGDVLSHSPSSTKCRSRQGSQSAVPSPSHGQGTLPYLPGDNVIFSELPSTPGIPVVYRTPEQRAEYSDRLNLDRIKNISNLENLTDLDVLDLHANQISRMENINHLTELRVLNLAGNLIVHAENMNGLDSLTELNLRRNRIETVRDADTLPCLQRFFLSFNNISRFENIACLADSLSLSEVTLDGNPIAQESWYKHTILQHMVQLRQLDMKKITEEERRMASVMARKEDDKKREIHKQAILKEKRRLAISNAARQWEMQQTIATVKDAQPAQVKPPCTASNISIHKPCHLNECEHELWPHESSQLSPKSSIRKERAENNKQEFTKPEKPHNVRSPEGMLISGVQGLSIAESHLAELERDTLHLYGFGALESLERSWGVQTAAAVTTVSFMFIDFDEIIPMLPRLRIKFPNILHFKFQDTNLHKLQQFNALALGRRLDQLTVSPQGNPVVNFSLWKYYVLFRLNHFGLQKINGVEVTPMDVVMGERLFGILARVAASHLPQPRLLSLLGEIKKKQLNFILEGKGKKPGIVMDECKDNIKLGGESIGRAVLNYFNKDITTEQLKETKMFCQVYVQGLVKDAALIDVKNESLHKLWPQIFIELVRDCVIQMSNKNSHMKLCLKNIMEQK